MASGEPSASFAPWSMTMMRRHGLIITSMLCSMTRKVIPSSALALRMMSTTRSISFGLMPESGSSSRISFGLGISMEANCRSFCWPKDKVPAGRCHMGEADRLDELARPLAQGGDAPAGDPPDGEGRCKGREAEHLAGDD